MPLENQTRSPSADVTGNTSPNQAPKGPQHNDSNTLAYATSTGDSNRNITDVSSLAPRLSPHRIWEMDFRRSEPSGHSDYNFPTANIPSLHGLRESFNDNVLTAQNSIGVSDISNDPRATRRITPTPLTIPNTPILLARSLPSLPSSQSSGYPSSGNMASATSPPVQTYRPRTRRIVTKETSPDDSSSVTELGMAPFMPGQDAMSNQNRLVRNESIMAQHFLRLKHGTTRANEERAKTEQNIYQMLAEHKAQINNLSATSTSSARHTASVRDDPEFVALLNAHREMRDTLEALVAQGAESSGSARFRRLLPSPSHSNASMSTPGLSPLLFPSTMHIQPSAMESENARSLKRKYCELPSPESLFRHNPHTPRPTWAPALAPANDRSTDVIYGPVSRAVHGGGGSSVADNFLHPDPNMHAIADEAVRDVGMHARVIRSVRRAHEGAFINIRFVKHEFATKFVELVADGHDGHVDRSATLVDADSQDTMGAPSSSKSRLW